MPFPDSFFRDLAIVEARNEGPQRGLDKAAEVMRAVAAASAEIPLGPQLAEALTAWGIKHEPGDGIGQFFGRSPTLKADLPVGWCITHNNNHYSLRDANRARRVSWHVHTHERIDSRIVRRYSTRYTDISATSGMVHILDGEVVIHCVSVAYPRARYDDRDPGDRNPYWTLPREDRKGWTANYKAREAAFEEAHRWLDAHHPLPQDTSSYVAYVAEWCEP